MSQEFVYHPLASRPKAQSRAEALADAATEYFAYIALMTVAVAVAVMTMAFSANVAFRWLDHVSKPGYFDSTTGSSDVPRTSAPVTVQPKRAQFAMLPAAMPVKMKKEVIGSNF